MTGPQRLTRRAWRPLSGWAWPGTIVCRAGRGSPRGGSGHESSAQLWAPTFPVRFDAAHGNPAGEGYFPAARFCCGRSRGPRRLQWAIAHELGEQRAAESCSQLGIDPLAARALLESIANQLANRLLLPSDWFAADAAACGGIWWRWSSTRRPATSLSRGGCLMRPCR